MPRFQFGLDFLLGKVLIFYFFKGNKIIGKVVVICSKWRWQSLDNANDYLVCKGLPQSTCIHARLNIQKQTRYLQNAAYIRLKNLSLGYTLPSTLTSKWGIQKVRFYFSGENLWTGTKLAEQFDPETIGTNKGNAYPLSKTLSCGLSLTF